MKLIRHGVSRWVVLCGPVALKFPSLASWRQFLLGLLANMQEREWARTNWPELCPIRMALPFGFLIIMERARELTDEEFAQFDYYEFVETRKYKVPVENKQDSFGKLKDKIVAVDYGN